MFKRGDIVTAQAWKDQEPTMLNTAMVTRTAKDGSWMDIDSIYGRKRIKNPVKNGWLAVSKPITIYFDSI